MTKKIKSRKFVAVEVKKSYYYYLYFLWLHVNICCFLSTIGTVYALLSILYFFKDVVKTKSTVLYYYRYLIIM